MSKAFEDAEADFYIYDTRGVWLHRLHLGWAGLPLAFLTALTTGVYFSARPEEWEVLAAGMGVAGYLATVRGLAEINVWQQMDAENRMRNAESA